MNLSLKDVKYVVLDEADEMLDMGFYAFYGIHFTRSHEQNPSAIAVIFGNHER